MEYLLVDNNGLVHGPYNTFEQARELAYDFPSWEIVNAEGDLFDWSPDRNTRESCVYVYDVDGLRRYVGKGKGGRVHDHVFRARSIARGTLKKIDPFPRWLQEAIAKGAIVVRKVVKRGLTDEAALAAEKEMIAEIEARFSGQLVNVAPGGAGGVWLPAALERMRPTRSASTKRQWETMGDLMAERLRETTQRA